MNYLDKIKNAMRPVLNEVQVNGVTFWVHRPTMQDLEKCNNLQNTLTLCVKDENGDPIFSTEDIDGRINVNTLDFQFATDLYVKVVNLTKGDNLDEVEKK